jgi:hypothetical protein
MRRIWLVEQYLRNFGWSVCGGSVMFTREQARARQKFLRENPFMQRKMRVVKYEPSTMVRNGPKTRGMGK